MMTFDEALDNFVNVVQQMINDHYRNDLPNLKTPTITVDRGNRYTKIVVNGEHQKRVYCFIDKNGDILKSASWRAPAKGVRGNIYVPSADAITLYGARYDR